MPLELLTHPDGSTETIDTRTADEVRADLLRLADYAFVDRLALGHHDATTGLTLAITDHDRAQFDQLLAHLERKGTPPGAEITIFTLDGSPTSLTYADLVSLLVRTGDAYLSLRLTLGTFAQTVKLTPDESVRSIQPLTF